MVASDRDLSVAGAAQTASLKGVPGMAFRCRNDAERTMEVVSPECVDLTGYHLEDLVLNRKVSYGQLIHPDDRTALFSNIDSSLSLGKAFSHAYRITTAEGREKWVWEQGTGVFAPSGELLGVKGFVTDITDRLSAYQTLKRRVEGRTRELSTLLEVSHTVASTLELNPLLGLILDQLRVVMEYSGAVIFALEDATLSVLAYRGPASQEEMLSVRFRLEEARAHREVLSNRKPFVIPDVRGADQLARAFQEAAGERINTLFGYVRSWMGIPLIARERVIGMLSLYHDEPGYYSPRKADLAFAFANEAALAIENARLYSEEQERRREAEQRRQVAEGLRDILTTINTNRPLDEILGFVATQAGRLLGSDAFALYQWQGPDEPPSVHASRGLPEDLLEMTDFPLAMALSGRTVLSRKPVVVPDMSAKKMDSHGRDEPGRRADVWSALLAVPIIIQKRVYGGLEFYYGRPRQFSGEEIQLALAFADQAALAIENALLRSQAEQAAVAAERNRLARDLHDAVTQTLFSASLIAEVLPRLWERNPEEGRRRLAELRQLTRGALAEMRTLLLELRPSALLEGDLGDLLRQLTEAIAGRARVPVALTIDGKSSVPPDVKVSFYRIAQEALNNVAKHSGASLASVELRARPDGVRLEISDDGCGFSQTGISGDRLGLGIMGERAETIGATLEIESQPGRGTRIVVVWKDEQE